MKKIILSFVLLFAVSFFTIHANTPVKSEKNQPVAAESYNISNFFKLIKKGDYKAVEALIKSGQDVNKKSNGLTPLMFAARYNKAKIAQLLIDNGAKLLLRSGTNGATALELAKQSKAVDSYLVIKRALDK